jgi:hypothetical protein
VTAPALAPAPERRTAAAIYGDAVCRALAAGFQFEHAHLLGLAAVVAVVARRLRDAA